MSTAQPIGRRQKRILLIANETCPSKGFCGQVQARAGEDSEVLVVAPALNTRLRHFTSDEDKARQLAETRLARSVENLIGLGLHPRGAVGDADPILAIQDALVTFDADEIIIATHPPERSNWLERGVVEKATTRFDVPVIHIVVDADG
jgi:hypothetical protein